MLTDDDSHTLCLQLLTGCWQMLPVILSGVHAAKCWRKCCQMLTPMLLNAYVDAARCLRPCWQMLTWMLTNAQLECCRNAVEMLTNADDMLTNADKCWHDVSRVHADTCWRPRCWQDADTIDADDMLTDAYDHPLWAHAYTCWQMLPPILSGINTGQSHSSTPSIHLFWSTSQTSRSSIQTPIPSINFTPVSIHWLPG